VSNRPDNTPHVWHSLEITCQGSRVRVVADGLPCLDADTAGIPALKDLGPAGVIALQSSHTHAGEKWVKFRNIRVKRLD